MKRTTFLFLLIFIFLNASSQSGFTSDFIISNSANQAYSSFIADIDGDGDLDVLSASRSDNKIAWYENLDGLGSFGSQNIISNTLNYAQDVFASDIDNDGDIDVVAVSVTTDKVVWYKNTDGVGNFSSEIVISTNTSYPRGIYVEDLDGDNDNDIVISSYGNDKIIWYENTDGLGNFSSGNTVTSLADGVIATKCDDIDGDGDFDIVSVSSLDNKVAWYENLDGLGTFGSQQIISNTADFAWGVNTSDIDNDGDIDIIYASASTKKVAWFENIDGNGNFSSENIISTNADGARDVVAFDVDNDGDNDIVSASFNDDKIAWYENTDGLGSFSSEIIISSISDGATDIKAGDINSDGAIDLVSTSQNINEVNWHKNLALKFLVQPSNKSNICPNSSATFYAENNNNQTSYKWERSTDNGITWSGNIVFDPNFSGALTNSMTIDIVDQTMQNHYFRCIAQNTIYKDTSNIAILTLDNEAPLPDQSNLPTLTDECSVSVPIYPTATDNCEGEVTATTSDPLNYNDQGTYTITWTYDDGNGNTSTQQQTVIVNDVTFPVANELNLPILTDECSLTVTNSPTAYDNCSGTITGTTGDALTYSDQGTYTITWAYDDGNGNISYQSQYVVIQDQTPPSPDATTLDDIFEQCEVNYLTTPTAFDNCKGVIFGTHDVALPINTQGEHIVTWTYDDGNGNTTMQTQTIFIDDTEDPVFDEAFLSDIYAECSVTELIPPTATDNCSGTIYGTHNATLPIVTQGSHTIEWTYDDGNGNSITQTQLVIIDDNISPVPQITDLPEIISECQLNSLTPPIADDNCAGEIIGISNVNLPLTTGSYTITWSYDDGNGNIATQEQIAIIEDFGAPIPDVDELPEINSECEITELTIPTATDNCIGQIAGNHNAQLPLSQGSYTITWTYDDGNGNISTQEQFFNVYDVTAPIIECATDITVDAEVSGNYTVLGNEFDAFVDDNCGIEIFSNDYNLTSTLSDEIIVPGTYTITWSATDFNDNSSQCSFVLTVNPYVNDLNSVNENLISVYPNPTRDVIKIKNAQNCNVKITDISGRIIQEYEIHDAEYLSDLSFLTNGVYFIYFYNEDKSTTIKIIKE